MLIVTADDLGRSHAETDVVLECHARGRVTATSAMVFMADSERAAALAQQRGIAVGLHLNLSERFTAQVSDALASSHGRVCRFLEASRYALLLYHPLLQHDFAAVVHAQLEEFWRLYGRQPNHVDGHQHMHLATNVLLQRLLPQGIRVRRSFTFAPGQKSVVNRRYRAWVDRQLSSRHALTDQFYSLSQQMAMGGVDEVLAKARSASVELMVHPAWPHEREFLMSDLFARSLSQASVRLSS